MGEEFGEGGHGIGLAPDRAEDGDGVETEGAAGGEAGGVDAAEGDGFGAPLVRGARGEGGGDGGVGEGGGRVAAGFGEGRENRREEDAGAAAEGGAERREVVAGAAGEGVGGGCGVFALVQAADSEIGGEVVVGVEDEARVELGGERVEKRGEAGAVPSGLAQVVVRKAGGEETRERGEFALVVILGGDEEEFHRRDGHKRLRRRKNGRRLDFAFLVLFAAKLLAALRGLDDEEAIAVGERGLGPGGAGDDGVVERDGHAAAGGEAELGGEGTEGGGGGDVAGCIV